MTRTFVLTWTIILDVDDDVIPEGCTDTPEEIIRVWYTDIDLSIDDILENSTVKEAT